MSLWKKSLLTLAGILVLLVGAVLWLGWSLGAHPDGNRLARIEASDHYRDGAFFNEEPQAAYDITWSYIREQFFGEQERVPLGEIPVVPIAPSILAVKPEPGLRATWLGHAAVLVEMDGLRLLIDPALSERASPFQFLGPRRFHPAPIAVEDLTGIDAVILSHNHYDHLDETTLRHLAAQGTRFYVPLGTGAHLEAWDIPAAQIHDMAWWQEESLDGVTIVATPTRHYSGRGLFDHKATHWASWSLIGPRYRVFYSGDSGYSRRFEEIGTAFGPFDLGIIKIGSYGPGQFWLDIHMLPEDAVQVALDVKAARMLPVHWATYNLAIHDWDEPVIRALDAADRLNVDLLTPKVGETVTHGQPFTGSRWWESVD